MAEQVIGRGVKLSKPLDKSTLQLEDFLKRRYNIVEADLNTRCKMLVGRIQQYIEEMRDGKMSTQDGVVRSQGAFLQTMLGILDSEPTDAILCWDILLFLANKHEDDLFNDRRAMRFYNRLPEANQRLFLSLMTLVLGTASPRKRVQTLKTYPIETVNVLLKNERQRTNLSGYYAANI